MNRLRLLIWFLVGVLPICTLTSGTHSCALLAIYAKGICSMAKKGVPATKKVAAKKGHAKGCALEAVLNAQPQEITHRPLTDLCPDPGQPRKNFDGDRCIVGTLEGENARIRVPLRIRPTPPKFIGRDGKLATAPYTIIDGETRWLAAGQKGLKTVPCLPPETIDEETVRCEQLASSATMTPLRPLEQADAIAALANGKHKLSAEEIAIRAGVGSTRTVHRALALSRLCIGVRAEIEKDAIAHNVGIVIASLHDPAAQIELCKHILSEDAGHDAKQARSALATNFHLQLVSANCQFDPADKTLPGGACDKCPKSTATQRSLGIIEDENTDARCTDRTCFHAKQDVSWERRKKAAAKQGIRVIEGAEAEKLFPYPYSNIPVGTEFVGLDNDVCVNGKVVSFRELLGDAVTPTTIARAHRRAHDLLSKPKLLLELRAAGHVEIAAAEDDEGKDEARGNEIAATPAISAQTARQEWEQQQIEREAKLGRVLEKVNPMGVDGAPSMSFWRFVAGLAVRCADEVDGLDDVLGRRNLPISVAASNVDTMVAWVLDVARTSTDLAKLVVEALIGDNDSYLEMGARYAGVKLESADAAAPTDNALFLPSIPEGSPPARHAPYSDPWRTLFLPSIPEGSPPVAADNDAPTSDASDLARCSVCGVTEDGEPNFSSSELLERKKASSKDKKGKAKKQ